jgi:hypothetical protein
MAKKNKKKKNTRSRIRVLQCSVDLEQLPIKFAKLKSQKKGLKGFTAKEQRNSDELMTNLRSWHKN